MSNELVELNAEWEAMNEELEGAVLPRGGATPEQLIEFGQKAGGTNAQEALESLFLREVAGLTRGHQIPTTLHPYSGVTITDPEELETLKAEQIQVLPTHRNRAVSFGGQLTSKPLWWFPIDSFEQHPLRPSLRGVRGAQLLITQELDLVTFVSAVNQAMATLEGWVDLLIFSSEPYEAPSSETSCPPMAVPLPNETVLRVKCMLATTKRDPGPLNPLPSWLQALREAQRPDGADAWLLSGRLKTNLV